MTTKATIKLFIPPVLLELLRGVRRQLKRDKTIYSNGIPLAWSTPYHEYKASLITNALSTQIFKKSLRLPEKYGIGVDERCVEYPWLFANLPESAKYILDAGSILNNEYILEQPILQHKTLHILTLAPEGLAFWQKGISYLYADLRDIPIRENYYDVIICLSTLEHVGCDNTLYTGNSAYREDRLSDFEGVVKEFRRVLKSGGVLFISVPFGRYHHFPSFQQFDGALLERAIVAFGTAKEISRSFYKYSEKGWQISTAAECAESVYVEWVARIYQTGLPDPIPVEADYAAAARAVACVKIVK